MHENAELVLMSNGFMLDVNRGAWVRGKYSAYFSGIKDLTIKYLTKVKKNDREELKMSISVYTGRYSGTTALDYILKDVCYEREN